MRIAVIGGTGFIGQEFARFAIERGHVVDVYGRSGRPPEGFSGSGYYAIDYAGEATGAVRDDGSVDESRDSAGISRADALVVLAAKRPGRGFAFADYESNVRVGHRCFELACANGIRNVVFASSKAVYSNVLDLPWRESMPLHPMSLYGASKAAVEQLAGLYNAGGSMSIKCLRLAQVIGVGEREGHLVATLVANAVAGKRQVVFGDGSQRRHYVYVKDVCGAILCALEHPSAIGPFNVGMSGTVSNLELAEGVNEAFGNAGNLVLDQSRPMSDAGDEMDIGKARRELGFEARYGLREALVDMAGGMALIDEGSGDSHR